MRYSDMFVLLVCTLCTLNVLKILIFLSFWIVAKRKIVKLLQELELNKSMTKKKNLFEQNFKLLKDQFGKDIAEIISDYNNNNLEEVRLFYFHTTERNSLARVLPGVWQ